MSLSDPTPTTLRQQRSKSVRMTKGLVAIPAILAYPLLLLAITGGVYASQNPSANVPSKEPATPAEWRLLGRALYKCGEIHADLEWIQVLQTTKSQLTFTLDPSRSKRDWSLDGCDTVLRLFDVENDHAR